VAGWERQGERLGGKQRDMKYVEKRKVHIGALMRGELETAGIAERYLSAPG
jgi:hypothetical protein